MAGPLPLPIDEALPELLAAVAARGAVVLRAPPGAGKTTRVPPALAGSGAAGDGTVVVLEPRRVAARAAARRIAEERGWTLGREVGWWIRFERRFTAATRVLFVTEGLLLRWLQRDPFLDGVGALVFDEFHERALAADLALALARQVRREARPDLVLAAMSATLDSAPLAAFLDAPVVASAGRLHAVETRLLERPDERPLDQQAAAAVRRALAGSAGDVLAFLPGRVEIARTLAALAETAREQELDLVALHGDLDIEAQDRALRRGARRRVVAATNVAETSVTVEGVRAVVDGGLARQLRFDPATGLDRLETVRISRAAADQRAGRAGREGEGLCLRLWHAADDLALRPFETPEIRRVDLAGALLELAAWGVRDPAGFEWFEAPEPERVETARAALHDLGALDAAGITPLGRRLVRLPLAPRLGRLVLEGERLGIADEAALAAALLADRDPFRGEIRAHRAGTSSDLADRLDALDLRRHRQVFEARDQIVFLLKSKDQEASREEETAGRPAGARGPASEVPPAPAPAPIAAGRQENAERAAATPAQRQNAAPNTPPLTRKLFASSLSETEEPLLRAVAAAYLDRLCRRREAGSERGVMVGGRGVRLARESAVRDAELFVAVALDAGRAGPRAEALVRAASAVERAWLPPELVAAARELAWDAGRRRVIARAVIRFEDLVLEEHEIPVSDAAAASELLRERAGADLAGALPLARPAVASLLDRLRFLARARPETGVPEPDDAFLRALLPGLCAGRRSFDELARAPLAEAVLAALTGPQRQALERDAPERLEVPSGSHLRVDYSDPARPVLAARIQELFGLSATPRLAGGRVPVLLHLLAPNGRPQQVTADLASFWSATYPEVRRELAGRYPKHAWPDDPVSARAQRRPRRR